MARGPVGQAPGPLHVRLTHSGLLAQGSRLPTEVGTSLCYHWGKGWAWGCPGLGAWGHRPHTLSSSVPTLPEGEEDDGLDGEELEDGLKGLQELPGGKVEKEQGIEGQAD